ncbi:alpha/beta fold hydrolase [Streptomyces shenzhenensis]|uniref:alpha/beta fold hydrolase n=1 Tax=Streptomyces shenzhenensis TaxID=943815 RepID=UPI003800D33F
MRAALVGIDGTGKTTVARLLSTAPGVSVVHAIRAHDDPDSPEATRSLHLARASAAADLIGSSPLKVAVLYLQLCQYAPAERRATQRSAIVLADRHPLVDPLVYLPMFARIAGDPDPRDAVLRWWAEQGPETARAVRDWLAACSGGTDPWALGLDLLRLAAAPRDELAQRLADMFSAAPPDAVVRLQLPVDEALRRTRSRRNGTELHEDARLLTGLARAYDDVLDWLSSRVTVHRVDCVGRDATSVADEVAGLLGVDTRAPAPTPVAGPTAYPSRAMEQHTRGHRTGGRRHPLTHPPQRPTSASALYLPHSGETLMNAPTPKPPMDRQAWLRRYTNTPDTRHRLVCLPHAGGSASFYVPLARALAPEIDVVAVQYPGRQDRRADPFPATLQDLAADVAEALRGEPAVPTAFFGHSMGAAVAFEAIRLLENSTTPVTALFASGRGAPPVNRGERVHAMSQENVLAELRGLEGTDSRMFDDPEIIEMIIPALRNDYRLIETYRYAPGPPVACPIRGFLGAQDPKVDEGEMKLWADHTAGSFDLTLLPGGHFYLVQHQPEILDAIRNTLLGDDRPQP